MAVLGHSGSQAPQLMHSARIFIAIEKLPPDGLLHAQTLRARDLPGK
jgi:hypothetical protein